MRLIHMSDLHYRQDPDLEDCLSALFDDVALEARKGAFDAIVFSGDLVQAGSSASSFEEAFQQFVKPLCEAASISIDAFVLAAGNHDIDRDYNPVSTEVGIRAHLSNRRAVDEFFNDPRNETIYAGKCQHFHDFVATNLPHLERIGPLGLAATIEAHDSGRLRAVAANSAWMSRGMGEEDDKGKMIVSRSQLDGLLASNGDDCEVSILVMHHPLDWLANFDRDYVRTRLPDLDLVLCGHVHDSDPAAILNRDGSSVVLQSGPLFDPIEPNSYSIVELDLERESVECHFRQWYRERRAFDKATMLANEGVFRAHLVRSGSAVTPASAVSHVASPSSALLGRAANELQLIHVEKSAGAELYEALIDPPAYPVRYSMVRDAEASGSARMSTLDLRHLLDSGSNVAIFGRASSGKTCALHWALAKSATSGKLPIFIDMSNIGRNPRAIATSIRRELRNVGVRVKADLSDTPELIVALDNYDPLDPNGQLEHLLSELKDVQLVVSVLDDGFAPSVDSWSCGPFQTAHLAPYRTEQMRLLVERMYPGVEEEWNEMVRAASRLLLGQGMERNPWTLVVVLLIYRYEPSLQKADVTSLTDKYVDLVLGKWQTTIDPSIARDIDHITRRDFLVELAVHLTVNGHEAVSVEDFLAFADSYLLSRDQEIHARDLLDDLVRRRVLGGTSGRIGFTPRRLFSFFQAVAAARGNLDEVALLTDPDAFDAVLHLAGLSRNRAVLLAPVVHEMS